MADQSRKSFSGKRLDARRPDARHLDVGHLDAVDSALGEDARTSFKKLGSVDSDGDLLPWQTAEILAAEADKKHKKAPVFLRLSPVEKAKLDFLRERGGINVQQFGKLALMTAIDTELMRIIGKK